MADSTVNINGIQQLVFQNGSLSFLNCVNDTITLGISGGSGTGVTLQTNSVNNAAQSILNLVAGTNVTLTNSGGQVTIAASGGSGTNATQLQSVNIASTTPQTGDILEYNQYGDNKWEPTIGFQNVVAFKVDGSSTPTIIGAGSNGATGGTAAFVAPTGTESPMASYTTSSTANSSAFWAYQNTGAGSTGPVTMGCFRRFAARVKINNTTQARYWIGLFNGNSTLTMPANIPNVNFIAFRYVGGTDTVWQAVSATSSSANTVTSTGISPSTTATHLFEITYDGTNVNYFIDGALVAQNSTNLPPTTERLNLTVWVDNMANTVAVQVAYSWVAVTLK